MSVADALIFGGFACVLAFVVIVLGRGALRKPQPGDVEMVLVWGGSRVDGSSFVAFRPSDRRNQVPCGECRGLLWH